MTGKGGHLCPLDNWLPVNGGSLSLFTPQSDNHIRKFTNQYCATLQLSTIKHVHPWLWLDRFRVSHPGGVLAPLAAAPPPHCPWTWGPPDQPLREPPEHRAEGVCEKDSITLHLVCCGCYKNWILAQNTNLTCNLEKISCTSRCLNCLSMSLSSLITV